MASMVLLIQDTLIAGLLAFDPVGGVEDDFAAAASEVEDYAQSNAPWEDRTGAAREGLTVTVDRQGDEIVLELAHSVDYGQWLETIQAGRFAIIMPTLEALAPRIFASVGAVVGSQTEGGL